MNRVIWAMSCAYPAGTTVPMHKHSFYHYFYVKSGEGNIIINGRKRELKQGFIYMMPPETDHQIYLGHNLVSYEIKFETDEEEKEEALRRLPDELDISAYKPEALFETVFSEMKSEGRYSDELVELKLSELLIFVLRSSEKEEKKPERERIPDKFAKALFYMERNLSEEISLATLAELSHTEKIYFLKSFKKEFGEPPMTYLRRMRIERAKRLLLHSDMNISQISFTVGFSTIHHFTSVFKKITGVSPSEYKRAGRLI
jgi:YesN/AraC family two-component response regulator